MYRVLFALLALFALSGAAVACDAQAFVSGYGVQQVVVPSYSVQQFVAPVYGVQALNVGYGFGRQQVIVNNHGFNRQAVVVGGHNRQQVIVQQNRGFLGFGSRSRVIINH